MDPRPPAIAALARNPALYRSLPASSRQDGPNSLNLEDARIPPDESRVDVPPRVPEGVAASTGYGGLVSGIPTSRSQFQTLDNVR